MRYVPRNCIREGSLLARPVYGENGKVLLREGVKMSKTYIKRLAFYGIPGAFIEDTISLDLEIKSAVTEKVKASALRQLTTAFKNANDATSHEKADVNAKALLETAEQIVENIISHKDVMLNLFDIKTYDNYTFFHCLNVAILSIAIGVALDYTQKDMVKLAFSALLHDIGKVFIDSKIINKKGRLNPEEMLKVFCHPKEGYDYVRKHFYSTISSVTARGILDHHERIDGSGYPNHLIGDKISTFGKIIAVADVYDALVSDRPYRQAVFPSEAIEYIMGSCGTFFDIKIVEAFKQKIVPFPVGTSVALSDGTVALVMENFEGYSQRPTVKVFMKNNEWIDPYILNLKEESFNITVVSATVEA
ncbi:MAG: HD-GYP domain-containing protein [Eubacterium sp.]|jgi:HD-GYP domain-containing protein (c-di-GMP phosphodiesterase class II)|nr:HD-GYP domain-containing protein [Eubacterium sp.]